MKRPSNRMEVPQNRDDSEPPEELDTAVEEPIGIPCKWCKHVANHPVQRTYPNKMRIRRCLDCRREFQTWEKSV